MTIHYSTVLIHNPDDNEPAQILFNKKDSKQAYELVDLLAYITHTPLFIDSDNHDFNERLRNLYENYPNDTESFGCITSVNLKEVLFLKKIVHPIAFSLYNTALKQPEPLAKCVFLFRIIEYFHENVLYAEHKENFSQYINRLFTLAKQFKYYRLISFIYIKKYHKYRNINQINKWKKEAQAHFNKSRINKNYDLGKEIYTIGRNGSAHGNVKRNNVLRQEDLDDYNLVKKINIFLELIVRFLIEKYNPDLKNISIFE